MTSPDTFTETELLALRKSRATILSQLDPARDSIDALIADPEKRDKRANEAVTAMLDRRKFEDAIGQQMRELGKTVRAELRNIGIALYSKDRVGVAEAGAFSWERMSYDTSHLFSPKLPEGPIRNLFHTAVELKTYCDRHYSHADFTGNQSLVFWKNGMNHWLRPMLDILDRLPPENGGAGLIGAAVRGAEHHRKLPAHGSRTSAGETAQTALTEFPAIRGTHNFRRETMNIIG